MPRQTLVEREIRQTKPFASSAVVPIISLLRTANVVERQYNALLEPYGITFQQFNVLSILRGAAPQGHPMLEIANRLIAVCPGVTRLIDKLAAKKLVERLPNATDRRQVICRITPEGLQLLASVEVPLLAADERVMSPLSEADRAVFVELLDRVRAPLIASTPIQESASQETPA
ncbi:MAG TPA: MarR family transcriptional regulator [Vicinamibacterales bacterium]|nr:MarR family transcriptional regulator [Vicinamibacterales bacterium]